MIKRQRRLIIISLLALVIVLAQFSFFRPIRDFGKAIITSPIMLADSIGIKVRNSFSVITSITELSKENSQLREQNNQLTAEVASLKAVRNENEQLREDLKFSQQRTDLQLMPATIINYSPIGTYQAVTINKGRRDGVQEDQAVVSSGYLLGKVRNVSESTAEVWLLSNRNLVTPVLLTSSQTTGILKGGIRGLVVDNIPVDAKIEPGELVVTSALEGLYPAGIAVGQIEEVISRKEEIFVAVRISTPLNIRSLQNIFIVQ